MEQPRLARDRGLSEGPYINAPLSCYGVQLHSVLSVHKFVYGHISFLFTLPR